MVIKNMHRCGRLGHPKKLNTSQKIIILNANQVIRDSTTPLEAALCVSKKLKAKQLRLAEKITQCTYFTDYFSGQQVEFDKIRRLDYRIFEELMEYFRKSNQLCRTNHVGWFLN